MLNYLIALKKLKNNSCEIFNFNGTTFPKPAAFVYPFDFVVDHFKWHLIVHFVYLK